MNHNSQGNNDESSMQYNAMMLESYDSPQNLGMEKTSSEEFTFPFSQELDPQPKEMLFFSK